MQKILSLLRRCVEDYDMIAPGERVAVGVSGGKDSLVLLAALARLAQFYPGGFSVEAFTVDMGTPGMDLSPLADYCRELGVPFHRIPTQMYHVIFETRREKNPCALCAKMRRGSLHTALLEAGKMCIRDRLFHSLSLTKTGGCVLLSSPPGNHASAHQK